MPRACSTLLQNILAQDPDIHATGTDGSLELLYGAQVNATNDAAMEAMPEAVRLKAWRGFCRGGLMGYVAALSNKPHTCIKSRGIGVHYNWYTAFMGEPIKVICMVRDLRSVLSSMEKIHRKNVEHARPIVNHAQMTGTTTEKRVDIWLNSQPVGLALERFWQMRLEGIDKQCLFVRAEDLASDPQTQMARIYQYLGLPEYQHDFDRVPQATVEDDSVYGLTPDLHKTRTKVEPLTPDYKDVLGHGLSKSINQRVEWYQTWMGYA